MKYWGFFAAKIIGVLGFSYGTAYLLYFFYPDHAHRFPVLNEPFLHDLPYTIATMVHFLVTIGLLWLAVWDQRYRCRTCLRRLRMPLIEGGWQHILFGPPRVDYICPFGHGTLRVPELKITGANPPNWERHDDIWQELYALKDSDK
jgi:hypothetical protein